MDPDSSTKTRHLFYFKRNDHISTEEEFKRKLDETYRFDFDPCPLGGGDEWNGLSVEWGLSNWINPPYSNIGKWLEKGVNEMKKGRKSVFLIPCRIHTKYWNKWVFPYATEINFIARPVRFQGFESPLPTPMCLVVFDPSLPPQSGLVNREIAGKQMWGTRNLKKTD